MYFWNKQLLYAFKMIHKWKRCWHLTAPIQYKWPNQKRSYQKAWTTWRQTIKQLVTGVGYCTNNKYLVWRWYYSPCSKLVFHIIPSGFQTYNQTAIRGPQVQHPNTMKTAQSPLYLVISTVQRAQLQTHVSVWWDGSKKITVTIIST